MDTKLHKTINDVQAMKSHKTLMNHNDKMLAITWNNFDDILMFDVKEMFKDAFTCQSNKQ